MTPGWLRIYNIFRVLHIYLALLGLILMLFFAVTGFVLNHSGWFGLDSPQSRTVEGQVPAQLLEKPDELAIAEHLRSQYGATGAVVMPVEVNDDQVRMSFRRPGRRFDAEVNRADGRMKIAIETNGVLGLLGDLHKGADAGRTWKLCIDAAAVLLAVASVTGLVLWIPLQRRRRWGLAALGAAIVVGVGACIVALR